MSEIDCETDEFIRYIALKVSFAREKSNKELIKIILVLSAIIGAEISLSCNSQDEINEALDAVQMDIISAVGTGNKAKYS